MVITLHDHAFYADINTYYAYQHWLFILACSSLIADRVTKHKRQYDVEKKEVKVYT